MATRADKLRILAEMRNPNLMMTRGLTESFNRIEMAKGKDGYTPIKGKDYFTPEEINAFIQYFETKILHGKDGKDGNQGNNGKQGPTGRDGYTPIRGVDYWTKDDVEKIIKEVIKKIPKPKDGITPKVSDIIAEIKKNPIEYKDVKGAPDLTSLPELISFLKAGGFRGGGGSGGTEVYYYDLTTQCDGNTKTFAIPSNKRVVGLFGTQFPLNYRPLIDYTGSGTTTLTLTSEVSAPETGQTLYIIYIPA